MSQNTSHAVMAQRKEARDSLDDFPSPPWSVRALIEHVIAPASPVAASLSALRRRTVWEPACNRGFMSSALRPYFKVVHTSDAHDYSRDPHLEVQDAVCDFLISGTEPAYLQDACIDWIITNPPFRLAEQFAKRAFEVKGCEGVALLVRTAFLEGVGRYNSLFKNNPPSIVAQFTERVPMLRGRVDPTGSTATAYCWLVWMQGVEGTRLTWIPPCRKQLERPGDYVMTCGVAA